MITEDNRRRLIALIDKNKAIFRNIVKGTTQEEATTYRDSGDGWTVLETLCHIRDFTDIFYQRAQMMVEQDHPQLPGYDHDAMVIERDYNAQDLQRVYDDISATRREFIRFFLQLDDAQWQRSGIHPERGEFSMEDALFQVSGHDNDHIEQITRILSEKLTEKPEA